MANAVFYCACKIKEGASVSDLLVAAKALNDGFISKQRGFVSWQQLVGDDTWADFITFDTMADVEKFVTDSVNAGKLAEKFYSFLDLDSCVQHNYTIERTL